MSRYSNTSGNLWPLLRGVSVPCVHDAGRAVDGRRDVWSGTWTPHGRFTSCNTVLLGQRDRSASQAPTDNDDTAVRFSLLEEAAAMVSAHGGTPAACQVHTGDHKPCPNQAEVKLADSGGGIAWVCLAHADEILVTVPNASIASQG